MPFVSAPLVGRVFIDRLSHLLRTGRADGPFRLVKLQARRLELQSAIRKECSHLGLGVPDHSFVYYAMNAPRRDDVHVRHQAHIVGVIMAEVFEIVSEVLTASEMLSEVRHAA